MVNHENNDTEHMIDYVQNHLVSVLGVRSSSTP
jgi:hypothetical protein